uniref:Biotin carboxyl carrier protein of acetyl-CoA carboxylase n=1 Tax=candidate division WOR-3 bacterium TaxID=2052148 RepID=A0A7C4TGE8_UNCW3
MKLSDIEKLIKILENSKISTIEVTDFWGRRLKISKFDTNQIKNVQPTPAQLPAEEAKIPEKKPVETPQEGAKNLVAIRSPIVGTFYRAPAPDAPPYVEVGDIVKPGQVVCIVEAMKLMNEIESDVAGRIVEILVKNEEPVEYNQELFLVEPL